MDQNIVISSYTSDDCDSSLRLWQSAAGEIAGVDGCPECFMSGASGWNRLLLANKALVARCGDEIVGMGVLDIDVSCSMCATAKIRFLCVREVFRRQGIGTLLVRALEKTAEKNMVSLIRAEVSPSVIPFFESLGYAVYSDSGHPSDLCRIIKEL